MTMKTYPSQSDYEYEIIDEIIIIYDLDCGNVSVTNDVRNVLAEVKSNVSDFKHKKIIYRDSEKTFDGIEVDEAGRFRRFYPIGETTLDHALAKINTTQI